MLGLLVLLLLLAAAAVRAIRGPVWTLAISWGICLLPIALGLISYDYLGADESAFWLVLAGVMLVFLLGMVAQCLRTPTVVRSCGPAREELTSMELARALPGARVAWWIATAGITALLADFFLLEGAGLNDLAALRDTYINADVSLLRQLSSVATWACLYCYGFALFFRSRLRRAGFALYLAPVIGYFLVALFSAGRQAAMQILLTTVLIMTVQYARGDVRAKGSGGKLLALVIGVVIVSYMGYVAIARNDSMISSDKVEVLARLFDFRLAPWFDAALGMIGNGFRTTVIEGLVYFSSSVALFSVFLEIEFPAPTFGAMTFPFVYRQMEWLTGIDVLGALEQKRMLINAAGAMGFGWTTGVSSYLMDFGRVGAAAVLFLQGYYSSFAWRRAVAGVGFNEGMIAVTTLLAVAYLPFIPATSDTNILLLWLFCVAERFRRARMQSRWAASLSAVRATDDEVSG